MRAWTSILNLHAWLAESCPLCICTCSLSWSVGHSMWRASTRMTLYQSRWQLPPITTQKACFLVLPACRHISAVVSRAEPATGHSSVCCLSAATGNRQGIDLVREMFENATRWNMNVVRIYAHTTDPTHAFMVRFCLPFLSRGSH